jgi:hypothetical protein
MRNLLLTAAIMLALSGASMASEQKKDAQLQSNQTEQTHLARNDASGPMDPDASVTFDCSPRPSYRSKQNNTQDDSKGDPQAPQNQVEYGGGG